MECEGEISTEDAPATFKSFVWQHSGNLVETVNYFSSQIFRHWRFLKVFKYSLVFVSQVYCHTSTAETWYSLHRFPWYICSVEINTRASLWTGWILLIRSAPKLPTRKVHSFIYNARRFQVWEIYFNIILILIEEFLFVVIFVFTGLLLSFIIGLLNTPMPSEHWCRLAARRGTFLSNVSSVRLRISSIENSLH